MTGVYFDAAYVAKCYLHEQDAAAPPTSVFLRSGDAIHLATALEAGFNEIWTNDRHLLAAAGHFVVKGRSV